MARTDERGWGRWTLGTEKPLVGTQGAGLGRRGGRDEPQSPPVKIALRIPTHQAPHRGSGWGWCVDRTQRASPPRLEVQPPEQLLGGRAATRERKVSPSWPQAPLTVTVSRPRKPCMLPVPYWIDRGSFRFWKVEDLAGSKR